MKSQIDLSFICKSYCKHYSNRHMILNDYLCENGSVCELFNAQWLIGHQENRIEYLEKMVDDSEAEKMNLAYELYELKNQIEKTVE